MRMVYMGQAGSPRGSRDDTHVMQTTRSSSPSSSHPSSRPPLRQAAQRPQNLFGSVHQIAGNLAAGMQRIGFQWGIPWGRGARSRRERETLPGSASPTTADLDEERRHVATQQILELSEEQIMGTSGN